MTEKTNAQVLDSAIYFLHNFVSGDDSYRTDKELRVQAAVALARCVEAFNNCPDKDKKGV